MFSIPVEMPRRACSFPSSNYSINLDASSIVTWVNTAILECPVVAMIYEVLFHVINACWQQNRAHRAILEACERRRSIWITVNGLPDRVRELCRQRCLERECLNTGDRILATDLQAIGGVRINHQ